MGADTSGPGASAHLRAAEVPGFAFFLAPPQGRRRPGTYNGLNAQLGFYTSIAGLGLSPGDTTFNGDVTVDAGSATLLEVGPEGASASHAAHPATVQDVFIRIGGAGAGKATTSMVINSNHTIVDHTWVWRADHGDGVGWETNRADYGVRVNGDDVLATGLFVEHFNKYDVEWRGERGRTVFFQNENAYDAPNQAAVQNGSTKGYAAYKIAGGVTTHEGWGLGSYCSYHVDPTIRQDHGPGRRHRARGP